MDLEKFCQYTCHYVIKDPSFTNKFKNASKMLSKDSIKIKFVNNITRKEDLN